MYNTLKIDHRKQSATNSGTSNESKGEDLE
jgi:hypothetical protein